MNENRLATPTFGPPSKSTTPRTRIWRFLTALAGVLVVLTASALAQSPNAPVPQPVVPAVIEAGALAALERMGAYLRTLKAFQVEAKTTSEEVLDDGQRSSMPGWSISSPGFRTGSGPMLKTTATPASFSMTGKTLPSGPAGSTTMPR